jgi:tetratricopeptide (TPR) repeat protein
MVSAGTNSVPAYNEYLKGLAYGISTATTSDPYEFLSAKDAFVRAIELDPEFALAYWELAIFWRVQLGTTNIVSGTLDLSNDEMRTRFDDAIAKAIEFEQDPVNKLRYRILRSMEYLQYAQALRMNIDYLEQRPNDQGAQLGHLNLLADMSRDDELRAAIEEFQERDGYDIFVVNSSMTLSLISDDKPFIRMFAQEGMRRLGDSMYVIYQAHRSLLWAGDIDGASQLVPIMRSSDLPRESVGLIELRQACAENKPNDAARVYDRVQTDFPDDISIIWISHKIMNQHDAALESLIHLDNPEGLDSLADFLSYAYFDARQFPILMAHLESQGIDPREPREIPYRCKL